MQLRNVSGRDNSDVKKLWWLGQPGLDGGVGGGTRCVLLTKPESPGRCGGRGWGGGWLWWTGIQWYMRVLLIAWTIWLKIENKEDEINQGAVSFEEEKTNIRFGVSQPIVKPNLQTSWAGHQIDITGQTLAPNQITSESTSSVPPESGEDSEGRFCTKRSWLERLHCPSAVNCWNFKKNNCWKSIPQLLQHRVRKLASSLCRMSWV